VLDQVAAVLADRGYAGLLYPVALGHLAPQDMGYRDVVLAQLAFALTTSTEDASGGRPVPITQER
jgi:hypothetical protein